MSWFDSSVTKRIFLIFLFTFILMRILYIYFHQYLDFKYIHISNDPSVLLQQKQQPSTIDMKISLNNNAASQLRGNSTKFRNDGKASKYNELMLKKSWKGINNNGSNAVQTRKRTRSSRKSIYEDWENVVTKTEMEWEKFVGIPRQPPRSKQNIPVTAVAHLKSCSESSVNTTRKGCMEIWNDHFIQTWKNRKVKGLCEENASSKIHCYDSLLKNRICVFENSMLNFRKLRKRKEIRQFEKGFLAADCGEMAPEDINYFQIYQPDIERKDELPCDYVFNETVLLYSHDNIRNFGMMINDYMNIWMMLWLSGLSRYSKDISLLHFDHFIPSKRAKLATTSSVGMGMGSGNEHSSLDHMNQFFKIYNSSFRRILRGVDFPADSRVCFKRIILPMKPPLSYQENAFIRLEPSSSTSSEDYSCSPSILSQTGMYAISSLFQRWNLQIRNHFNTLIPSSLPALHGGGFHSSSSSSSFSSSATAALSDNFVTNDKLTVLLLTRSFQTLPSTSNYYLSRVFANQEEIIQMLKSLFASLITQVDIQMKVIDLTTIPFEEQIVLMSQTSLIIGMSGSSIANSLFMPVGTRYCCGVIEIFPSIDSTSGTGSSGGGPGSGGKGFRQLSKRLGHLYHRMDIVSAAAAPTTSAIDGEKTAEVESKDSHVAKGTTIPLDTLKEAAANVINQIVQSTGSCLLPEVLQQPYF